MGIPSLIWTPYQREIFFEAPKNHNTILMPAGRRLGKTIGVYQAIPYYLSQGIGPGLIVDVTMSNIAKYIDKFLMPILRRLPKESWHYDGFLRRLTMGGTYADFRSATRPELIEGDGMRFIIINEAGIVLRRGEYLYNNTLRMMMMDFSDSRIFLVGTPKGRNLFYELHEKAERGVRGFFSKQYDSYQNPFFTRAQIDDAVSEVDEVQRQQEVFAQFLASSDVFVEYSDIQRVGVRPLNLKKVVIGVDLAVKQGEENDYTAATVLGLDNDNRIYVLEVRRSKIRFHEIIKFITALAEIYKPHIVGIEEVQAQAYVVQEMMRTTRFYIRGITVKHDKSYRFNPVASRYQKKMIYHVDGLLPAFERELLAFPTVDHDDMVDSMSVAFECLMMPDKPYQPTRVIY